ncbi:zinc-binding dehydrogenase [Salmonella enterica]|nr:zinc-binding dehydrogenase [Salmonella enterica]
MRVILAKENTNTLERMNDLITAGTLQPPVTQTYPLIDAGNAVAALESSSTPGRLALTI